MNNKEVVKKIKEEFYFVDILSADCAIDSLIRIDENIYDCEKCALVDTVSTVREGMVDKSICPMIMEEEVKILR